MSVLGARVDRLRSGLARDVGVSRGEVRVVVSPYRICPIGAHSDHQHGPVLGMAIDAYTLLAFVPQEAPRIDVESAEFAPPAALGIGADASLPEPGWHRYAFGAGRVLAGRLGRAPRGLRARVEGTLAGAGLSSSASVVIAYLLALAHANDLALEADELATLAVRVENEYAGVACGVLDPACIAGSRRGHLLAIETAPLAWEPVAFGGAATPRFLVVSTGRPRHLAATGFNARVEECFAAARALGEASGRRVERLGELDREVFETHGDRLPETLRRRARHFFTERERVREGLACWRVGDLPGFGERMSASCESSIHSYETGSPELVALQALLLETPGVLGARFSGAGFGGCSLALVEPGAEADVTARLERAVPERLGPDADTRILPVEGEDAARVT